MKDLSKHIEYLLLTHDCVTLPGLGSFVAMEMDSQTNNEENAIIPPYRTVHFNNKMTESDGLLENSLCANYHISHEEAEKWCTNYYIHISNELAENGTMDFGSIGEFTQSKDDNQIIFFPCSAGVTTPKLFGLDRAEIIPLTETELQIRNTKEQDSSKNEQLVATDNKHIVIRIPKNIFRYACALVGTIILFFAYGTPVKNDEIMKGSSEIESSMYIPYNLFPHSVPKPAIITAQEKITEEVILPTENTQVPASTTECDENIEASNTKIESQSKYAIVLASSVTKQNAEIFIQRLKKMDIEAELFSKNNMNRVIIPGFEDESKARLRIQELRDQDTEFNQIWLLKMN